MDKAITLSSGGVDSTTLVGMCIEKFGKENVVCACYAANNVLKGAIRC